MSVESAKAMAGVPIPASPIPATTTEAQATTPQLQSTPLTHLAKKEAEIVRQRQEVRREQDIIRSEKQKIAEIKKQYDEYQATKSKDPIAALKQLGFSEQDVFNYMAASQPEELTSEQKAAKAAEQATDAKIQAFEQAQLAKQQAEQARIDNNLITNYRASVSKTIEANPEKYEYCAHYGPAAENLIYETVLAVVNESKGKDVPTAEEAAEMVEQYYEEQDRAMSALKKRQPKTDAVPTAPLSTERTTKVTPGFPNEPQPKPTITHNRTLHNGAKATIASTRKVTHQTFTDKRERLIQALRDGKL